MFTLFGVLVIQLSRSVSPSLVVIVGVFRHETASDCEDVYRRSNQVRHCQVFQELYSIYKLTYRQFCRDL